MLVKEIPRNSVKLQAAMLDYCAADDVVHEVSAARLLTSDVK
jgi:hypothetical protein